MYDVIILGAGPAGYVAAERAGSFGKKALLIEKDRLGGVCLNTGCVPTKSFLHAAKLYNHALHAEAFGVTVQGAAFDYGVMRARTGKVQDTLRGGVAAMLKKHKVEVVSGAATVVDANTVRVGQDEYRGANLLIAVGCMPAVPPVPGLCDNPAVVDAAGILAAESLAESVVIIGGGVIGVEFAFFHSLLGKRVTVLEALPRLCGVMDNELAMSVQRRLEGCGVTVKTGAVVERVEGGEVFFVDKAGAAQSVAAERVLVATGRVPCLDGIGLEALGVEMEGRYIRVDERGATNIAGVYAAGDVTGRRQLAHFASRQATVAINTMFGIEDVCREVAVPSVIYGDPEVASVGLTEAEAKERGLEARTVKMMLGASGRFLAETEGVRGFVKAVVGGGGEVLGLHVVGPYASEMIGAACVMIEKGMRASEVCELVFPHPTVAEIMKEVMSLA